MVSEQTRSTADDIKNYIKQHGIEYRTLFDLLDVAKTAFELFENGNVKTTIINSPMG